MTDEELLVIARKYEVVLVRLDSGEIEKGLNRAIMAVIENPSPANELAAGIVAAMKQFIFGGDVLPDLVRIKEAVRMWDRKPDLTLADL